MLQQEARVLRERVQNTQVLREQVNDLKKRLEKAEKLAQKAEQLQVLFCFRNNTACNHCVCVVCVCFFNLDFIQGGERSPNEGAQCLECIGSLRSVSRGDVTSSDHSNRIGPAQREPSPTREECTALFPFAIMFGTANLGTDTG